MIFVDVQSLCIMHFVSKIGFQANEAVTQLKMIEKGLKKEDLALSVLIEFPFQLLEGYLAARWARGDKPLRPWIWAFWGRLGFAVIAMITILIFPKPPISTSFFIFIVFTTIASGFTSLVAYVFYEILALIAPQHCPICGSFGISHENCRSTNWRNLYDCRSCSFGLACDFC